MKNTKMSSFKSSENMQKKDSGSDRSVSDNQSSSVTLNELAMKARKTIMGKLIQRASCIQHVDINILMFMNTLAHVCFDIR